MHMETKNSYSKFKFLIDMLYLKNNCKAINSRFVLNSQPVLCLGDCIIQNHMVC